MIRIEQQRDLGHQIMTVRNEEEQMQETLNFREQMLVHNRIDGMIPFEIRTEAGDKIYEYDIENLESLSEYCARKKPGKDNLDRLLKGILAIVIRGREFMLAEDDYLVKPDSIFVDKNENVYMACYPGYGENLRLQLKDLAEFLMNEVDYTDEAAVLSVYGFYMRTKEASTTFEDLLSTLAGVGNRTETATEPANGNSWVVKPSDGNAHAELQAGNPGNAEYSVSNSRAAELSTGSLKTSEPKEKKSEDSSDRCGMIEITPDKAFAPVTASYRRLNTSDEKSEEKLSFSKVFLESPLRLKLVSLFLPLAAVIIFTVLRRSGMLDAAAGRMSTVKAFLAFTVLAAGCIEAEKLMWQRFAKDLAEKFNSAKERADEETVLLYGAEGIGYAFSLVSDTDPPINVSHFPFFVGKDASRCDYVLASQIGVSRFHMKIDRDGEDFTISDLNSTNGTYINGERLAPHYPKRVRRGDELRIGKCIYYCN